jgi:hypothetical protein
MITGKKNHKITQPKQERKNYTHLTEIPVPNRINNLERKRQKDLF